MTGIEIPMLPIPKVALVTGGNSGIGKATAARLAAMGSVVVVGYNSRRAQAEEVIGCLEGRGHLAIRRLDRTRRLTGDGAEWRAPGNDGSVVPGPAGRPSVH